MPLKTKQRLRLVLRILLGIFFIFAGIGHFTKTAMFVAIVPPFLPFPLALVYISGIAEILGGLGVLIPKTKRIAGNCLLLLLIAVFPANIHMAINKVSVEGIPDDPIFLWARLPIQFIIMFWVWWS